MSAAPPTAIADRFALIIDGLCRAMAASRTGGLIAPLMMLLWNRLRRTATRFATLTARVQAGTLRPTTRPRARRILPLPLAEEGRGESTSRPPRPPLPRAFGWLMRLFPGVACARSQLRHLLSDPELAELLSAAPQIGRLLRPLCHMLAIGPSPDLPPTLLASTPQSLPRAPRNTETPASTRHPSVVVGQHQSPSPPQTGAETEAERAGVRWGAATNPRPHPPPDPLQPLLPPPAPA